MIIRWDKVEYGTKNSGIWLKNANYYCYLNVSVLPFTKRHMSAKSSGPRIWAVGRSSKSLVDFFRRLIHSIYISRVKKIFRIYSFFVLYYLYINVEMSSKYFVLIFWNQDFFNITWHSFSLFFYFFLILFNYLLVKNKEANKQ